MKLPAASATLKGDEDLPEPWCTRFRTWLAAQNGAPYVEVTGTLVMSNDVSILLLRRTQADGVCLEGPSKLDWTEGEGAPELTHFGDDCCRDTSCKRGPDGWNLRYLSLLADRNWSELSRLVPAKSKLTWSVNGEAPSQLTRAEVAAGGFADAPGCGLMYNETGCTELDEQAMTFTCRCDGGGYHVTYTWQREGDDFVLSEIYESSH